jgi:Tfp pilus assembly protein PilF
MSLARRIFFALLTVSLSFAALAADKKPDRAEAARLNNLGIALMNQQMMEKAVEKFDLALQADPSLSTAELNKGIALLNLQKLNEAEEALRHATAAQPENPRTWYNLGLLHRGQGKGEEGIEDFKKVIALAPSDPDANYFVGQFYLQLQKYDEAVPYFQQALKLNPLHASAEFGLARALQRSGHLDEARVHLKTFEHLTRNKIASPMTLAYGDQGPFSMAQDVFTGMPNVGAMIPISMVPVALGTKSAAANALCLLDVDSDGKLDIVSLSSGDNALAVLHNDGKGVFKPVPAAQFGLALKGKAIACAAADFDNDDKTDLAVALEDRIVLFKNQGGGKFVDVTKAAGIEAANVPTSLTWVDYDHDGDLDLIVTGKAINGADGKPGSPNVVWRNNGNGTFTNSTAQTNISGEAATTAAILSDINNDRAVDLVVAGATPSPLLYANQREGKFKPLPVYDAALPPTVGITVFDFNKDGWMDVAVTHAGAPGVSLWKNIDGKRFERVPLPIEGATKGWGITPVDIDNDGWIDLAAVVETAKGTEVRVLRNMGKDGWADVSKSLGLDKVQLNGARTLVAADLDGDGDSDLLLTQVDGPTLMLRNDGGNKNHSLRIALTGLADAKSAFGTKVEVFADGLWQKWEVTTSNEILAGLGTQNRVDIVRMLWATGVLQDETEAKLGETASYVELDRRGSSCPTLFAWNGTKFEFISDVIGAAVIGHWVSPTEKNIADPDEWLKIEGSQLKPRNGKLSVRFGEPMEEVNYVDQVRMVAVDHPEGTDVFPNERFLSNPPFPEEKTIVTSAPHLPAGAWTDSGHDAMPELRYRDHRYVKDFEKIAFAGYANMHGLTLDLGQWSTQTPLRMYLHGFIEYFTATSMYAAWQAKIDPIAPYLEAQMPDGTWKRVIDDMGFPAGLPRTIVVDLTGKLPAGTRKIRIATNLQIYWDQILIDNGPDVNRARVTELPLASASMRFYGYPQQIDSKETPGDLTYNYQQVSQTGPFSRQQGTYTRYGNVTSLLTDVDDHYVIFGSGEEIDADFDANALRPLPAGWKRDYFFYANGFVKDMDFYEASPFTVAEMPFHKMSAYPYPETENYPDDADTIRYMLDWNDRFDTGRTTAKGYQFKYESRKP